MYLTRNQAWAQVHRGFESHPLRQKIKAPLGAFVFCRESEHARGWDSKRRACKRGAGRIPPQRSAPKINISKQKTNFYSVFIFKELHFKKFVFLIYKRFKIFS